MRPHRLITLTIGLLSHLLGGMPEAYAQTTMPAIPVPARSPSHAKLVYTQVPLTRDKIQPAYPGTLPYVVDGGGRYDADPRPDVGREDSFWIGGYYGVGATQENGWKPTGDRWQQFDEAKLDAFLEAFPPGGLLYVFNHEHWRVDARRFDTWTIEESTRKFRHFLGRAKTKRPDGRWAIYAMVPVHAGGDYYNGPMREGSLAAMAKQKRGELLNDGDYWWIGNAPDHVAKYAGWTAATDRLSYGLDNAGKAVKARGLADAVDAFCPSGYVHYPQDSDAFLDGFVRSMFQECRRLDAKKRVLWFVWDKFHSDERTQLPLDMFRRHCERLLKYGDGLVLWGISDERYIKIAVDAAERANR